MNQDSNRKKRFSPLKVDISSRRSFKQKEVSQIKEKVGAESLDGNIFSQAIAQETSPKSSSTKKSPFIATKYTSTVAFFKPPSSLIPSRTSSKEPLRNKKLTRISNFAKQINKDATLFEPTNLIKSPNNGAVSQKVKILKDEITTAQLEEGELFQNTLGEIAKIVSSVEQNFGQIQVKKMIHNQVQTNEEQRSRMQDNDQVVQKIQQSSQQMKKSYSKSGRNGNNLVTLMPTVSASLIQIYDQKVQSKVNTARKNRVIHVSTPSENQNQFQRATNDDSRITSNQNSINLSFSVKRPQTSIIRKHNKVQRGKSNVFKSLETYKMSDLDFYKTGLPGIGNLDKQRPITALRFDSALSQSVLNNTQVDVKLDGLLSSGLNMSQMILKQSCKMNAETVKMQVNKYVHPSLIIPVHLNSKQVEDLLQDHQIDENHLTKDHIKKFDNFFTQRFVSCNEGNSRIRRFKDSYKPSEGYDSEEEETLCQKMFFDDLLALKKVFNNSLLECLQGQIKCEQELRLKTAFFMKRIEEMEVIQTKQQGKIQKLEKSIKQEQSLNMKIFVDEEVAHSCQAAYFSYELLSFQENKVKDLQDQTQNVSHPEFQGQAKGEIQDLQWQMACAEKSSKQVIQMLENKLSMVMAELKDTQKTLKLDRKKDNKNKEIQQKLEEHIKDLNEKLIISNREKDILKFKISDYSEQQVTLKDHQRVLDELELVKSNLKYCQKVITQMRLEEQEHTAQMKSISGLVQFLCSQQNVKYQQLYNFVKTKCEQMMQKLDGFNQVFRQLIMYSNKEYFYQEIKHYKAQYDKLLIHYRITKRRLADGNEIKSLVSTPICSDRDILKNYTQYQKDCLEVYNSVQQIQKSESGLESNLSHPIENLFSTSLKIPDSSEVTPPSFEQLDQAEGPEPDFDVNDIENLIQNQQQEYKYEHANLF